MYVVLQTCVDRSSVHHRTIQEVNLNCYFLLQKQNFNPNSLSIIKSPVSIVTPVGALQNKRCLNSKTYNKPSNLPELLSIPLGLRLPLSQHGFPYRGTLCKSGKKGLVTNFSLYSKSVPAIEGAWTLCLSQFKCKMLLKKRVINCMDWTPAVMHMLILKSRGESVVPLEMLVSCFLEKGRTLPSARSGSCCQVLDIISNLAKKMTSTCQPTIFLSLVLCLKPARNFTSKIN